MAFFLISFIICFSVGLLLSLVLVCCDVRPLLQKPNGTNERLEHLYMKERVFSALLGTFQAALFTAGTIAIALGFLSKIEMFWVDIAIRCNLHLLAGANVRMFKPTLRAC